MSQQKKIGCNIDVRGVDNELLCSYNADYCFITTCKVPNSSNGHIFDGHIFDEGSK